MILKADVRNIPIQSDSVQAIITSPPYFGCDEYDTGTDRYDMMVGTEESPEAYAGNLEVMLRDCKRVLRPDGVMWLVVGDDDTQVPIPMAPQKVAIQLDRAGWIIVQEITWHKIYNVSGRARSFRHPQSQSEKIYMLARTYEYKYKDLKDGNVWKLPPSTYKAGKWAMLPPGLIERCLIASTDPGDIVLDPFSGSGLVPQIAESMFRIGIGSDINPT